MIISPKTIIRKDNKSYKLVCSINKDNYSVYPHLEVRSKLYRGQFPFRPYNKEDLEMSYKIQAAKKIIEKNKAIDRHRNLIDNIIKGRRPLDFEDFVYNSIYNYIDNKVLNNQSIIKNENRKSISHS
jgi:hypothetical protein